jgi:hypothetical protein
MMITWWVFTIEIPGRNLFRVITNYGVHRSYAPITIWAFRITGEWIQYRWLAVVGIFAAIIMHYWFSSRLDRYDVYGRWLYKAVFVAVYILLYGSFLLIFAGAELPIWTWPSELGIPVETP